MPDYLVREVPESELQLWDELLKRAGQSSIFSSTRWLKQIAETFSFALRLLTVEENGRVVAGIPLFAGRRLGVDVIRRPPLGAYNEITFFHEGEPKLQKRSADEHSILASLLGHLEKKYGRVRFSLSPDMFDVRPFLWRGWTAEPRYTYHLSLSSTDLLWENLSSSLRRKLRANEWRFERQQSASSIVKFMDQAYQRTQLRLPAHPSMIERLCERLMGDGSAQVFTASAEDGTTLAARAILMGRPGSAIAYDWLAGAPYDRDVGSANHALLYHIIEGLAHEGITQFDFLGANTPSIAAFKRQFGGELRVYFDVAWFGRTWIRAVERMNDAIIRLRRKV